MNASSLQPLHVTEERTHTDWISTNSRMGLFLVPVSPVPPKPTSASDRLCGFWQDGRSLESPHRNRRPGQFANRRFPPPTPPVGIPLVSCRTQKPLWPMRNPPLGPDATEQPKAPVIEREDWLIDFWAEPAPSPLNLAPGFDEPAPGFDEPAPGFDEPAPGFDEPAPGFHEPASSFNEPAPAGEPTPLHEPFKPPQNLPKYVLRGEHVPVGGEHVGVTHVGGAQDPPWPHPAPDLPWAPTAPDPPWPPSAPDLPWPPTALDPSMPPTAPDLPWPPRTPDQP
ncbi:hypothetical protein DPX16_22497 [Anabarilius grahami]|uniref:Uncharacterized protein n=1 Tax=Anabarilius grahami TaxID=495550 RepID=A0A3N0YZE3_ANAGA|nr:hypothetical protein DPX16_22497 [Anabarilius grahami]